VVDGVDTARRENKRASQINSLINEWYCEELSDNIRAVLRRKREMGQYLGNYAPYGYEKSPFDHHVLVPCSQRAQVVAGIFRLYLMGFSCGGVAGVLDGGGVYCPRPWHWPRRGRTAAERRKAFGQHLPYARY